MFWYNDHFLMEGCLVRYNKAAVSPGGIRSTAFEVSIFNSTISGNIAGHDYGGIYIDFSLNTVIKNTDVSNNTAHGTFYSSVTDVNAVGCGGIGLFNCWYVELDNCTLNFNNAYLAGGALIVLLGNTVTIRNSAMRGNVAISGAAVEVYSSVDVVLDSLDITGNSAGRNGGGLSVSDSLNVSVMNSAFVDNSAGTGSGSACHIVRSTVHFEGNKFDGNEAQFG